MTDRNDRVRGDAPRVAELIDRSLDRVESTIATVERVIAANRALANRPSHAESAARRIVEGEEELAALHAERAALARGDVDLALGIAVESRGRRSRGLRASPLSYRKYRQRTRENASAL